MLQPQDFWDERRTEDEIRIGGYFEDNDGCKYTVHFPSSKVSHMIDIAFCMTAVWPEALELSRDKPLLMSAFGGLVSYLREVQS